MKGLAGSAARAARLMARTGGLAARRRLIRMPIEEITDEFGFSLSAGGWHPLVEALQNYDRQPLQPVETTRFGRFFLDEKTNAVRNLNDLFDLTRRPAGFGSLPPFWLGTYPWGGLDADAIGGPGPAFGWAHDEALGVDTADLWGHGRTLWYRPANRHTISNERHLTVELYRSIRRRYSPVKARGFPRVTLLVGEDGRRRAVIVDGHHRLAVLAHLGARAVTVEIEGAIEVGRVDQWYYVRNGHCTPDEAMRFFDAFFVLDGSERFDFVADGWSSDSGCPGSGCSGGEGTDSGCSYDVG